jgi:hypothetical protein
MLSCPLAETTKIAVPVNPMTAHANSVLPSRFRAHTPGPSS